MALFSSSLLWEETLKDLLLLLLVDLPLQEISKHTVLKIEDGIEQITFIIGSNYFSVMYMQWHNRAVL